MIDQIIKLKEGATRETLKLNEDNFWFSTENHASPESMKAKVEQQAEGYLNSHGIVPYASITKIKMNEKSDTIWISYSNSSGKEQELDLSFENVILTFQTGHFIADNTNLTKTEKIESFTRSLLMNLLWIVGTVIMTWFIAFGADSIEEQGSYSCSARRARSAKVIINMLHDAIGQIGILLIGFFVTLYLIYTTWYRLRNPVNDVVYQ